TPAQRLRLYDRGIVSPGKRADLVLLSDLASFKPAVVVAGGRVVASDGAATMPEPTNDALPFRDSVRIGALTANDFRWRPDPSDQATSDDIEYLAIRA